MLIHHARRTDSRARNTILVSVRAIRICRGRERRGFALLKNGRRNGGALPEVRPARHAHVFGSGWLGGIDWGRDICDPAVALVVAGIAVSRGTIGANSAIPRAG